MAENLEELVVQGQSLYEIGSAVKKVFAGVGDVILETTKTANDLRIQFQQTFGIFEAETGAKLLRNLAEYNNQFRDLEIRTEKLAANFKLLGTSLNSYVYDSSEKTLFSLAKTISLNEKFGIQTGDSVRLINTLTTNFGMGTDQAQKFNSQLIQFAEKTGQPFNKVFEQFNKSIGDFYTILDPTKAASQFTSFQQLARGFGAEINEFMKIAEKFDTIEGGVKYGADLNNVLSAVGGSFDAIEASMMSYDDRIKYTIKSISDSREQIMQMDDISRQAYVRQLKTTSELSGQTIQAILNNEKLVGSVEELTTGKQFGKMEGIGDERLGKMATNFTKFQDRADQYMDQYLRLGIRLERYADAQTKRIRDVQVGTLNTANNMIFASNGVVDLLKNIKKQFSQEEITKTIRDAKDKFDKYVDRTISDTNRSLSFIFDNSRTPVLPTRTTPGVTVPPAGTRTVGQLGEGVTVTESIRNGISDGIKAASKEIQSKEMKITIDATPQLKALLNIQAKEMKPTAAITGVGANR
jgi:hypothetical protein